MLYGTVFIRDPLERTQVMPTIFVRCMLFISSYFPLTLIFWILFIAQQPVWAWSILGVGLIGLFGMLIYFFKIVPEMAPIQEKVTGRQVKDGDVMGYIASYIIPFVTFPLNGWQQIATLVVFVAVLGIVYINSDMIRINPMLNLMGYHLYEITVENGTESYSLITRNRIKLGETVHIVNVGRGIFLEKVT
jgi:hypothetical protein